MPNPLFDPIRQPIVDVLAALEQYSLGLRAIMHNSDIEDTGIINDIAKLAEATITLEASFINLKIIINQDVEEEEASTE